MGKIPVRSTGSTGIATPNVSTINLPRDSGTNLARDEAVQKEGIAAIREAEDIVVKVRDTQQINAANVYVATEMENIKQRAAEDPDFNDPDKYSTELNKIGADAAKNITGELAKNDFSSRYKVLATATHSAIKNSFRERQLQAAHADFLSNITALEESYFNAVYPQEKAAAAALIKQSIADNVKGMVVKPDEGVKIWEQVRNDLPVKDAMRDIGRNPITALQRLKENAYGIVDEGERAKLMADAEKAAIREKKMQQLGYEQAQEKVAIDLTSKLWDGTLTLSRIQEEMNSGILERKDAEHLKNALISDRTSDLKITTGKEKVAVDLKQAGTYMAMWDMILKKGKATDKRRTILKEFADGNLRKEDAVKLYTGYLIPAQGGGKVSLAEEVAAEQSRKLHWWGAALKEFQKFYNMHLTPAIDEGDTE